MSKRRTIGTIARDERLERLMPLAFEQQEIAKLIDQLLGCFVELRDGTAAEVIGVIGHDVQALRVEWLAGDAMGECLLSDTKPVTFLPKHLRSENNPQHEPTMIAHQGQEG